MKFKYIGDRMGNVELALSGVIGIGECLEKNETYDIPDDNTSLIRACKMHPHFVQIKAENKPKRKTKKEK